MVNISLEDYAWTASSTTVYAMLADGILELRNDDNEGCVFMSALPFEIGGEYARVSFQGEVAYGAPPLLVQSGVIAASHEAPHREIPFNSQGIFRYVETELIETRIYLPAHSGCLISAFDIEFFDGEPEWDNALLAGLEGDILILASECPLWDGDHDKLDVIEFAQSVQKQSRVDVVQPRRLQSCCSAVVRGVQVWAAPFQIVRSALRRRRYETIVVLGFNPEIALILQSCYLGEARIVIVADDESVLYRAEPLLHAAFFDLIAELGAEKKAALESRDAAIRSWSAKPSVAWVFRSQQQRRSAEESLGLSFANARVVQLPVHLAAVAAQDNWGCDRASKILAICDFSDTAASGADLAVRALVSLSRTGSVSADVYGAGPAFDRAVAPLYGIEGIAVHNVDPSPELRAKLYATHGIALLPWRVGVYSNTVLEALLSGLAVVAPAEACTDWNLDSSAIGISNADYGAYARAVRMLLDNQEYSVRAEQCCHTARNAAFLSTDEYAMHVLAAATNSSFSVQPIEAASNPVLTIAIPAYNTEHFLEHGVRSVLDQRNAALLEVVIVNDGSTDGTLAVANRLAEMFNAPGRPVIKVVDKKNGGHGSAINVGIAAASGKYFRVMDSDDWMDSSELERLIDVLKEEDSDIVITDYSEDRAVAGKVKRERIYGFMDPGMQYAFDDVCTGPYGFPAEGPIIASSNFKTTMLQRARFKLSEHRYYVDMEFDAYAIYMAETITFYSLDVYRYFVGRATQSVTAEALIRNRDDHEYVIMRLIDILQSYELSPQKHAYILRMVQRMACSQYLILGVWLKDYDAAQAFDDSLKEHPEAYELSLVCTQEARDVRAALDERKQNKGQSVGSCTRKGKRKIWGFLRR